MVAWGGWSDAQVRWAAPLRVAPPRAARSAAESSPPASHRSPPFAILGADFAQPPARQALDSALWVLVTGSPAASAAWVGLWGELAVRIDRSGHVERAWASSLGRSPSGVRAGRAGVVGGTGGGAVELVRM